MAGNPGVTAVVADFELPVDLAGEELPFGGLSGLTYDPACGLFYAVTDDRGYIAPPRFYTLRLDLDTPAVLPVEVVELRDPEDRVFDRGVLDPESISLSPEGILWIGTEGGGRGEHPPRILGFRLDGALVDELVVPPAYLPGGGTGVRSNHGFEGLSVTPDGSRIVAAVESALTQDGPEADLDRGTTVRLVVFDVKNRGVVAERAYRVEPVPDEPRPPSAYRTIGVSEILALDNHRVLVVERSFSAGVGNTVRIYLADLTSGDDITGRSALNPGDRTVDKTLLIDLAEIGVDPDNLEGLSFGPVLGDGRPTLVLVADNNFQPEVQANQLVVLAAAGIDGRAPVRPPVSVNAIQAASHVSPLVGRCVAGVEGTVTAILGRRTGQAFWIQQDPGDEDLATSEGLFVTALEGAASVEVGDLVRLTGRIEEPRWRMELPVTRMVADGLEIVERGRDLPEPVVLGSGGRTIPSPVIDDDGLTLFEPETDAIDFYESLEAMRVRVEEPIVVGPTSKYGEIVVLGDGGAGAGPRSDRGGVVLRPDNAHPERITIDDRLVLDPPDLAVGDSLVGPVDGVLHYSYGSFKLLNTESLGVERESDAEPGSTSLTADEDHITIATLNVENLAFTSAEEKFKALAEIIVDRLGSPTVLAVQEIQDDSGPEDDGVVSAELTLHRLVEAVVSAGGSRYRWSQIDPADKADGGRPGANIRVALLFDPHRSGMVEDGSRDVENPGLIGVGDGAFAESRKPLVVHLEVDGVPISFVVCHLRSKGGDDPLFGRRQPPLKWSEEQRLPQTELVRSWIEGVLGADPGSRIVVLGDLNDFEFSPSVGILGAPPMVNLMERLPDAGRSTYVYRGNSQILDHIIVSAALAADAEIEALHINADSPAKARPSDHDPVVVRVPIP